MTVLMFLLEGPMQSWGTYSRFYDRDSGREPSKSGIIGLICSALGRRRDEDLSDLSSLRMGIRVESEGRLSKDFHTVLDVPRADKSKSGNLVSMRYYLADACFLVFLEGDEYLLTEIRTALANPKWCLYLGRKSFPLSSPMIFDESLREGTIEDHIHTEMWHGTSSVSPEKLRAVIESDLESKGEARMDVPVSFSEREFSIRYVRNVMIDNPYYNGGS